MKNLDNYNVERKKILLRVDLNVPVVVRLEGTNADIAKDLLGNANVDIIPANSLADAAQKVVEAATGRN